MDRNIEYHFNVNVACEVGVNGAIILNNIRFWIMKNEANGQNFFDGEYWTYNSYPAMAELFPFWSEQAIRREIGKLEKNGYLKAGNYNKLQYDRTKWYTLTRKAKDLFKIDSSIVSKSTDGTVEIDRWSDRNRQMEKLKSTDGSAEIDRPIPYIKPDNKTHMENNNNKTEDEAVVVAADAGAGATEDAEVGECVKLYEDNIRPICGGIERDIVLALIKDYGAEWFKAALKEAVTHSARSVKYIESILKNWQTHGRDTKPARVAPRAAPAKSSMQEKYEGAMAIIRAGGFLDG